MKGSTTLGLLLELEKTKQQHTGTKAGLIYGSEFPPLPAGNADITQGVRNSIYQTQMIKSIRSPDQNDFLLPVPPLGTYPLLVFCLQDESNKCTNPGKEFQLS